MSEVQRVWDINGTAFNSWNFLRDLIATASKDDVQPGAILAAEAIGTHMIMYDERIVQANTALGADANHRLLQTRMSVGLHYGDTLRALQMSTPLKKFFVFISGLKLRYSDTDIADILYLMIKERGLREEHPLSPMQFEQLLKQVSGHAWKFAPEELMHNVTTKVFRYPVTEIVYERVGHEDLAKLFFTIFEALLDVTNSSICLTVNQSGLWLATTIHWWLEDQSCVVFEDEVLHGQHDSKVKIVVAINSSLPWTVEVWTSISHPSKLICAESNSDDSSMCNFQIPLRDLAFRMQVFCLQNYQQTVRYDSLYKTFWLETTTQVASSLIFLVCRRGTFRASWLPGNPKVMMADVAHPEWIASLNTILTRYGFCPYNGNDQLLDLLDEAVEKLLTEEPFDDTEYRSAQILMAVCKEFIQNSMQGTAYNCEILLPACRIACDVILTCTTRMTVGTIRSVIQDDFRTVEDNLRLLARFICPGFGIKRFLKQVFEQLLLTEIVKVGDVIAYSGDGSYAMLNMIRDPSSDPAKAMLIEYGHGTIKHEGVLFSSIAERVKIGRHTIYDEIENEVDNHELLEKAMGGVAIQSPYKIRTLHTDTQISVSRTMLLLQQFILATSKDSEGQLRQPISWIDTCVGCALAWNKRSLTTAEQHNALARRLQLEQNTFWGHPLGESLSDKTTVLVDTRGNDLLKTFSIGLYVSRRVDHKMFVCSSASGSLLPVLDAAAKEERWIVFL